jgi:hypothetical protein
VHRTATAAEFFVIVTIPPRAPPPTGEGRAIPSSRHAFRARTEKPVTFSAKLEEEKESEGWCLVIALRFAPFRQYQRNKEGSGTPTGAHSTPHLRVRRPLCEGGSPIGVPPRLSPQRVSHPHGSVSGQASWDVVCVGVTQLRLSQSSVAPHTPVIVPEGMMPEPPGTGCIVPPRAPHSLHPQKVPPLEASLMSEVRSLYGRASDGCQ